MADIFLSYARDDQDRARAIAVALQARGWSVWWDSNISPGESFDEVIEHELETARCVVVLWSERSIHREWVKNEAAAAAERGVLVPAFIDPIQAPLEFRRRQTADLVGFKGDPAHPGFASLCRGIAAALGGAAPPQVQPLPNTPSQRRGKVWAPAAAVVIAIIGGAVTFHWWPRDQRTEPAAPTASPNDENPAGGPVSNRIFDRLAQDQREGLELLLKGAPGALEKIDGTLGQIDRAAKSFPQQGRFLELKGYLQKDVYQSKEARQLLTMDELRQYLSGARQSSELSLKIDPKSASAHNLMGNVLYFEGDCSGAVKEYDRALQLNQNSGYRSVIEADRKMAVLCAR
jgi:tetratricopeptide (TPR) repeat protein